jgi:lysophospholipase L1-like esterase
VSKGGLRCRVCTRCRPQAPNRAESYHHVVVPKFAQGRSPRSLEEDVAGVRQGNDEPPVRDADSEVFERMGARSRRLRFLPMGNQAALEGRTLLTALSSGLDLAEEADSVLGMTGTFVGRLETIVTTGPRGILGASRTGRSPVPINPPVRMAKRPPARPIVQARNANRLAMPTILPAAMTAASTMQVEGDWSIRVTTQSGGETKSAVVAVPAPLVTMTTDNFESLPVFDTTAFGWLKGQRLAGVSAQEGVVSGALDADSVLVRIREGSKSAESIESELIRGIDYEIDPTWGTIGRLEGGRIGELEAVTVTYRHVVRRLDAVILQADGQIVVRSGVPSNEVPVSPVPGSGEKLLGRVFITEFRAGLNAADLFPVMSTEPAAWPIGRSETVASLLPDIMRKLKSGKELRILAWGDSVTDGRYLPNPSTDRWQDQFVAMLKKNYPRARITLVTEAWPGHGTADYLAADGSGSSRFASAVLGARPDLVIAEFVNDGYWSQAETVSHYETILESFRHAGIEWIVMTPHFTHRGFMGFGDGGIGGSETRPYVAGLKEFAAKNKVPIADSSALWADAYRQGMPYESLLSNAINHPNAMGQRLYAEALRAIFAR